MVSFIPFELLATNLLSLENLSVYGEQTAISGDDESKLSIEERAINEWLTIVAGVVMSDPLEIVHAYFEKKKKEIRFTRNAVKKPSNLWQRRKENLLRESSPSSILEDAATTTPSTNSSQPHSQVPSTFI